MTTKDNLKGLTDSTNVLNLFYQALLLNDTKVPEGILDVDANLVMMAFMVLSKFISEEEANSLRASIFFNNCNKVMILNKSRLGKLLYKGAKIICNTTNKTEKDDNQE